MKTTKNSKPLNIVGKTENKPLEGYEILALFGPFDHK